MTKSLRIYGHKRDSKVVQHKVFSFNRTHPKALQLPSYVNLIEKYKDLFIAAQLPYDQGQLGSCTSQGLAFAFVYNELSQHNKALFMPARLFIYYNERSLEDTVNSDSGAQICDGVAVLKKYGVCEEKLLPYDCSKFTLKPSVHCYDEAEKSQLIDAQKLDITNDYNHDIEQIKSALASGHPIVFGFNVYESFESDAVAQTGVMPMPHVNERYMGGHCVVAVGYDDKRGALLVRNSWGTDWGCSPFPNDKSVLHRGYFWMPYHYVPTIHFQYGSNCSDFWTLGSIEDPAISEIDNYDKKSIDVDVVEADAQNTSGGVVNPF